MQLTVRVNVAFGGGSAWITADVVARGPAREERRDRDGARSWAIMHHRPRPSRRRRLDGVYTACGAWSCARNRLAQLFISELRREVAPDA